MATTIINYTNPLNNQFFNLNKQTYPSQQWVNVDVSGVNDISFQQIPRSLYIGSTGNIEVIGLEGLFVDQPTITPNPSFTYPDGNYVLEDNNGLKYEVLISGSGSSIIINVLEQGYGYTIGDTITILGSVFGGVNGTDDITFDLDGNSSIFKNIPNGTIIPIQPRLIILAGTNCDDIIALY